MGKLVRDKIPDLIRLDGRAPHVIALTDQDYRNALSQKLRQEVYELLAADGKIAVLGEVADILEVLSAIVVEHGATLGSAIEVARYKREQRGGFKIRLWLESPDTTEELTSR